MITLSGEELFEYLHILRGKVDVLQDTKSNGITNIARSQLSEILGSEEAFLRKFYPEPVLSFSGNGFSSVESLVPDLEKMSEVGEEFGRIQERYQGDYFQENNQPSEVKVKKVDKKQWKKERDKLKDTPTNKRIRFGLRDNEGKLEVGVREETYIANSFDSYSQNIPILSRSVNSRYQIIWGNVFDEHEESFYIPEVLGRSLVTLANEGNNQVSLYQSAREVGSAFREVSCFTVRKAPGFLKECLTGVLIIPTHVRKLGAKMKAELLPIYNSNVNILDHPSSVFKIIAWPTLSIAFLYPSLIIHPIEGLTVPVLATHLTTNALSGLYEIGRHLKIKKEKEKATTLQISQEQSAQKQIQDLSQVPNAIQEDK